MVECVKEFLIYSALRAGLLVVSFAVVVGVWALLADGQVPLIWAALVALVLSGIASYFLLNRQRNDLAQRVEGGAHSMSERFDQIRAKEDVD